MIPDFLARELKRQQGIADWIARFSPVALDLTHLEAMRDFDRVTRSISNTAALRVASETARQSAQVTATIDQFRRDSFVASILRQRNHLSELIKVSQRQLDELNCVRHGDPAAASRRDCTG